MKETEDFSLTDHIPSYSSASFPPHGSKHQDYLCIYSLGIKYTGRVEKVKVETEIEIETKVTQR